MTVTAPRRAFLEHAPRTDSPAAGSPCPLCGSPMVLRTTPSGERGGTWFWGCSRFPACRGMLSAPQPAPVAVAVAQPVPAARPAAPRRAKPRVIRTLALVLLVTTLVGIALIGSVPALLGR